jgi:hypothetical protein
MGHKIRGGYRHKPKLLRGHVHRNVQVQPGMALKPSRPYSSLSAYFPVPKVPPIPAGPEMSLFTIEQIRAHRQVRQALRQAFDTMQPLSAKDWKLLTKHFFILTDEPQIDVLQRAIEVGLFPYDNDHAHATSFVHFSRFFSAVIPHVSDRVLCVIMHYFFSTNYDVTYGLDDEDKEYAGRLRFQRIPSVLSSQKPFPLHIAQVVAGHAIMHAFRSHPRFTTTLLADAITSGADYTDGEQFGVQVSAAFFADFDTRIKHLLLIHAYESYDRLANEYCEFGTLNDARHPAPMDLLLGSQLWKFLATNFRYLGAVILKDFVQFTLYFAAQGQYDFFHAVDVLTFFSSGMAFWTHEHHARMIEITQEIMNSDDPALTTAEREAARLCLALWGERGLLRPLE